MHSRIPLSLAVLLLKTDTYDTEGAKAVLEEAGWVDSDGDGIREKDGQKLTIKWLTYPSRQELPLLAESAQSTLKDIGMDVQINSTADHNSIWKDSSAWDVYVGANVNCGLGDPTNFFSTHCLERLPRTVDSITVTNWKNWL